jgi:hypothetical protein
MKKFVLLMNDGRRITVEADLIEVTNEAISLFRGCDIEAAASFFRDRVQGWWRDGSVDAGLTRAEIRAEIGAGPAPLEPIEVTA